MDRKQTIIIGSGLGGLSTAVILAKNGYRVTVLEQGPQTGGCLQCFTRKGAVFETGMHFIGSADKGQSLRKMLSYLGALDGVRLSRMDPTGYERMSLAGGQFAYANGREAFIETLARPFPKEKDNLARYFDLVTDIANASTLHSLKDTRDTSAIDVKWQMTSIDEVLDELFDDELLRRVLVGNLPLYAAERGKTPFATHAFIMDFYNQSAWRVAGGSDTLAKALVKEIERNGGEVLTRKQVTRILTDNEKATGVVTADGTAYPADLVISAIHPARTVGLTDTPLLRPAYRNRIARLPETTGCFTLYLKFKEGQVPYLNANFYGYRQDTPWGCEEYTGDTWPKGYLYMHMCAEDHQQRARSGVIVSYMNYRDVLPWEGTAVGRRGADYEAFKREKAERLFDLVEKDFPHLRDGVEAWWTSTPLTYRDYTGTEAGAMYGIAKDITMGPACRVHHRTKIPNLLLTGQNINSHGMLGVLVGTIVTCSELLGGEYLLRQIIGHHE